MLHFAPVIGLHQAIVVATAVILAASSQALAFSGGISGFSGKTNSSCNSCHSGGMEPSVRFEGPRTLDLGETGSFQFIVHSNRGNRQSAAGLNLAASAGTLAAGSGMDVRGGEIVHTKPKANNASDDAVFSFEWTAPAASGNYTLFGAGNSVNENMGSSGDLAAKTTFSVVVGKVASTPTASPSPTATATPTPTASVTVALTASPTLSPPPSTTPTDIGAASPTATSPAVASATPRESTPTVVASNTASPTRTPTKAVTPGDVNCNKRVTAADMVQLVELLSCNDECEIEDDMACGGDINRDGAINQLDIDTLLQRLFAS